MFTWISPTGKTLSFKYISKLPSFFSLLFPSKRVIIIPSFLPSREVHLVADMAGLCFPSLSTISQLVQVQLLLNYKTTNIYKAMRKQ